MKGRIVDIKRFAVHDGPGIRTTIFLKGCSLACRWCHNPESISPRPEIGLSSQKCTGCQRCVAVCPNEAHVFHGSVHTVERSKCVACGSCVAACLSEALEYHGRQVSVEAAVAAVLEDKTFYANSGGGCTISGGEPLLQAAFCAEVFKRLHKHGIHCAIDTAAAVPWENIETVLPNTDLFLCDLKHVDERIHREWTGVSNRLILANLSRLSSLGAPMEIRLPLVPGVNDAERDLRAVAAFLRRLPSRITLRLVPYHSLARSKYEAVGRPDTMPDVLSPDAAALAQAAAMLCEAGVDPVLTP